MLIYPYCVVQISLDSLDPVPRRKHQCVLKLIVFAEYHYPFHFVQYKSPQAYAVPSKEALRWCRIGEHGVVKPQ